MRVAYSNVEAAFAQIPLAFLLVLFRSGSSRGIRDTHAGDKLCWQRLRSMLSVGGTQP